jgi:hypothetical protein
MSTSFLIGTNDYTETTKDLAVTRLATGILNDSTRTREDAFKFNPSYVPRLATQCSGPTDILVIEIQIELPKLEEPKLEHEHISIFSSRHLIRPPSRIPKTRLH